MAQVWSFMNLKGGVGKTTLTANLCRAFVEVQPRRILMVDTDPQCSLTLIFRTEEEIDDMAEVNTFVDILTKTSSNIKKKIELCASRVWGDNKSCIDLIPSHSQLIRPMIASMLAGVGKGQAFRFEDFRRNFESFITAAKEMYDLVVIDTNPSGNIATYLAVGNADFIVAPVSLDRFSIRGIALVRQVFTSEFDWLEREPWRMIPVINKVKDAKDAVTVRQKLDQAAHSEFGKYALIEPIFHSGFLDYNDKKCGFVIDRKVGVLNVRHKQRLVSNLTAAAGELIKHTGLSA